MKYCVIFTLAAFVSLFFLPVYLTNWGIPKIEVRIAEAGPLSRRLGPQHSQHSQSADVQSDMNEVDPADKQKCIEMLKSGDAEGAQACLEELGEGDSGDSGDNQSRTAETQKNKEVDTDINDGDVHSAMPIGKIVTSLPDNCDEIVANNVMYSHCGSNYFRAAVQGSNLVFVSVENPVD